MVIEILSPSTRKKDMGLKLKKYITARVREYWMVDPDKKKVVVYDLENEEYIYPVMVLDGIIMSYRPSMALKTRYR